VSKPALPQQREGGAAPPDAAAKGTRTVRWARETTTTPILTREALVPGNVVAGPAIVESEATTLAIPPGRSARLDGHLIFHISASEPASPDGRGRMEPEEAA
jgi:acetone carboxylase beta subunit